MAKKLAKLWVLWLVLPSWSCFWYGLKSIPVKRVVLGSEVRRKGARREMQCLFHPIVRLVFRWIAVGKVCSLLKFLCGRQSSWMVRYCVANVAKECDDVVVKLIHPKNPMQKTELTNLSTVMSRPLGREALGQLEQAISLVLGNEMAGGTDPVRERLEPSRTSRCVLKVG